MNFRKTGETFRRTLELEELPEEILGWTSSRTLRKPPGIPFRRTFSATSGETFMETSGWTPRGAYRRTFGWTPRGISGESLSEAFWVTSCKTCGGTLRKSSEGTLKKLEKEHLGEHAEELLVGFQVWINFWRNSISGDFYGNNRCKQMRNIHRNSWSRNPSIWTPSGTSGLAFERTPGKSFRAFGGTLSKTSGKTTRIILGGNPSEAS